MPRAIAFTAVDVSDEGVITCAVHRHGEAQELWFRLPYAFTPAPDLIAAVYAGLCGEVFDEVQIDLPIGPRLSAAMEKMTGARVEHAPSTDLSREPGTAQALNFSGGFDSLAARLIMPEAHLVSLDFGGRFARERPVYSRFPTHIVETNLVDLGLNLHGTEAFMSSAGILLRDELDLAVLGSGDIQASSLPAAFTGPVPQRTTPVAEVLGLGPASPVAGVSEAGTMLVCARRRPELLLDVLASVAHRGEVKYHRKRLLLEAVARRAGLDLALPDPPCWGSREGGAPCSPTTSRPCMCCAFSGRRPHPSSTTRKAFPAPCWSASLPRLWPSWSGLIRRPTRDCPRSCSASGTRGCSASACPPMSVRTGSTRPRP